jgi:hypothetical protein
MMKKIKYNRFIKPLLIFLLLLGSASFVSCKIDISSIDKEIAYLNEKEVSIFSYKDDYPLFKKINSYVIIGNVSNISLRRNVNIIIVNASTYYKDLNVDFVNSLYDLLYGNSEVCVIFLRASNYNFFNDTKFANEKNNYGTPKFAKIFHNLTFESQVLEVEFDVNNNDASLELDYPIIHYVHDLTKDFYALF